MKIYFLVMNGHHCTVLLPSKTLRSQSHFSQRPGSTHLTLATSNESFFFFLFLYFISELTHYENQRVLLSRLPKNTDPRFYLFTVSGIECPVCTNVPGLGAGNCDSGKVANVTCPDGLNQCMSLKGKMMLPGFTKDIKLKNCSNNVLCDSASDYNGKNITATNLPPPFPAPIRGRLPC